MESFHLTFENSSGFYCEMFLVNKLCNSLIYKFCNNCFCRKSKIHKFLTHIMLPDRHPHMHTHTYILRARTHALTILEGVFMLLWLKQVCGLFCPNPLLFPIKKTLPRYTKHMHNGILQSHQACSN